MLAHPLIHAFIAAADKHDALARRHLLGNCLREHPSLRRQQHHRLSRVIANPLVARRDLQRLDALEDWLRLQHHAFAAAEWPVIHGAMAIAREIPQVVNRYFNEPGFARPAHDAIIQRPAKEVGKYRDDLELHSSCRINCACALRRPRATLPLPASGTASLLWSAAHPHPADLQAVPYRCACRQRRTSSQIPAQAEPALRSVSRKLAMSPPAAAPRLPRNAPR